MFAQRVGDTYYTDVGSLPIGHHRPTSTIRTDEDDVCKDVSSSLRPVLTRIYIYFFFPSRRVQNNIYIWWLTLSNGWNHSIILRFYPFFLGGKKYRPFCHRRDFILFTDCMPRVVDRDARWPIVLRPDDNSDKRIFTALLDSLGVGLQRQNLWKIKYLSRADAHHTHTHTYYALS